MKKTVSIILLFVMVFALGISVFAKSQTKNAADVDGDKVSATPEISADGAYLMEASSGRMLYSKSAFEAAPLASVTKVMTLLIVCEALDSGSISLDDEVMVSAYAASMGGSQVFLEEGERISVEDLIKCAVIASANDASVALAELVAGSERAFVDMMNRRAAELGLKNSHFENTTGLDDTVSEHYSCPSDIAVMSRALISHDIILKYSSIWQDTIRDGEFTLTNTNRLVRYYDGCNGLKTGSTDKAGYCVSATAKRGNMQLIAVVMGAESRDARNEDARALLDYGFASFALYERQSEYLEDARVIRGKDVSVPLYTEYFSTVIPKSQISRVELHYQIPESIDAPILSGATVGKVIYTVDGEQIGECAIYTGTNVEAINFGDVYRLILRRIFAG